MDLFTLAFYLILLALPPFVVGVVLINKGKQVDENGNRKNGKLHAGWILVLISSIQMGLSLIGAIMYGGLFAIILWSPLIILVGLIITLAYGINYLTDGYGQHDRRKISIGWTLLIINSSVVTALIVLLLMFMNGWIPIRLM